MKGAGYRRGKLCLALLGLVLLVGGQHLPQLSANLTATATSNNSSTSVGNYRVEMTPIPADCEGKEWNGATVVHLTPAQSPYHAGNGKQIIIGTPGDDVIYGGNGKECISGGEGDDTIFGGNSPDYIDGGPGTDQCDGGLGPDTIVNCEDSSPPPSQCEGEHHSGNDKCKKEGGDKSNGPASSSAAPTQCEGEHHSGDGTCKKAGDGKSDGPALATNNATTRMPAPGPGATAPSRLSARVEGKGAKLSWSAAEGRPPLLPLPQR